MAHQYIYTMVNLRKVVPPQREILKGIYLSFLPGAKIGVLGLNGVRQVHAPEDHGRRREGLRGRGVPGRGHPRRVPARRTRGSIRPRTSSATSRRASPRRARSSSASTSSTRSWPTELSEAESDKRHGRVPAGPGRDRGRQRVGARPSARDRDGRAAAAASRRRRHEDLRAASGAASRSARSSSSGPTCCSWTSRPTTSTPSRSRGSSGTSPSIPGTVVAVTHDRYFLDNVAGWILELDRGAGIPWKGNYSSWLEQKEGRLELEEKAESRQAPHAPARARVDPDVAARAARQEPGPHRPLRVAPRRQGPGNARSRRRRSSSRAGPRLGDVVVRAEGVRKAYGDRLLMEDLVLRPAARRHRRRHRPQRRRQDDALQDDRGSREAGRREARRSARRSSLSYVDQDRDRPDPSRPSTTRSRAGREDRSLGKREIPSRAYVAMYNFKGADQQKRVGDLSGGEMNRLHLARTLEVRRKSCCSWTSRRTTSTSTRCARWRRRSLDFGGCAVVISHDRWFLDRIATHILAFEGDSQTVWFEGNYQEYEADRKRRLGIEADQPHRIKYKKLPRGDESRGQVFETSEFRRTSRRMKT